MAFVTVWLMQFSVHAQTNGLVREWFSGLTGTLVSDLTNRVVFPGSPTTITVLTNFEAPTDVGDNYGQRVSGWITAPATGSYVFWIAGDDQAELNLSTNDQPASSRLIARVPGQTAPREWTKYPEQQSASIPLAAGQRYYIEALMKEATGPDHLAVRWRLPGNTIEEPVPGTRLQVYRRAAADSATLHHHGKVRIPVTLNDAGFFDRTVQIVTPPAWGSAGAKSDGTVLYAHTNGTPASDTFTYQLAGPGGPTSTAVTVTVNFATAPRLATDTVRFPAQPPLSNQWELVEAFPGLGFNSPNCLASAPGDALKLFLVESKGRVWMIPDVTVARPTKVLFLDLQDRVRSDGFERGAKGVACHPNYSSNGFIYVTYDAYANGAGRVRLSRFTRSVTNSWHADPASEVVLIDQLNEGPYHDINTCRFGPDGYLYVSIGDEGYQGDDYHNAQVIDRNLYSCILRLDVDKKPGNLEPTPHPGIPRAPNGQAYYSVPADNPFVGATNFNRQPVNTNEVRTEMYVVGLRNPWQFSFDPWTNRLWVADVGDNSFEKLVVLGPGGNAGWSFVQALYLDDWGVLHTNIIWQGPRRYDTIHGARYEDATITPPFFEYVHGNGTHRGNSITGGFIYQGTNYPGLNGKYVFGDFVNGNVWSIDPADPYGTFTRITGGNLIVSFLADPSNNDILLIQWAAEGSTNGRIMRLVHHTIGAPFPQTLSETGFFADLADLSPSPGVEHYDPNLRFWSDHADKSRWFLIKDPTNTLAYSRDGVWTFPAGMVWGKHFDLNLERGNPATRKRIETRFLVKTTNGAYGVTYKWNDPGTEAYLEPEAGEDFDLTVTNGSAVTTQRYHIPSRAECLTCHSPQAGSALSFNTRQLNRDGTIAGGASNQLAQLAAAGYLQGLDQNPTNLPRHYRAGETNVPVEARARSYLAVNCSYCHQAGGSAPPSWDGRPQLSRAQTGLINGPPLAAGTAASDRLIIPGDLRHSVVWSRVARTNGLTAMPPLASNEPDTEALQLLSDWILIGLATHTNYDVWRSDNFGDLVSPPGAPDADPDGDGKSNQDEFLEYTNPNNGLDFYRAPIQVSGGQVRIARPPFLARKMTVFTSTNLGLTDPWALWPVPGNGNIPPTPGQTNEFIGPVDGPQRFFKVLIEQP